MDKWFLITQNRWIKIANNENTHEILLQTGVSLTKQYENKDE